MTISPDDITIPTGVKDFLPAKAAKIEYLDRTLADVFARWGFRRILPPALEYLAVLERGLGAGLSQRTVRFDDRLSGQLVAFSPDITPQVARIVATRLRELPLPLRLSYSGRVLRHAEQQSGKDREIFQSGVELIGLESVEADAEMIAMVVEGLQAIGAKEFSVDIGQVEFFRGVMDALPEEDPRSPQVAEAIGRKDVSGLAALVKDLPVPDRAKEEMLSLPRLFGGSEVLERAATLVRNERSRRALDSLVRVREILKIYGVEEAVTFDLGELRGLGYHTGITFQGFLSGLGRAVCSGGRYDGLVGRYGFPVPATGFAFNLLNLLFALDRSLDQRARHEVDVLLFLEGEDKAPAQRVARKLRARGLSATRDMVRRDLEESLAYARSMHYRYILIFGQEGSVRLRHVSSGRETVHSLAEVLSDEFNLPSDEE